MCWGRVVLALLTGGTFRPRRGAPRASVRGRLAALDRACGPAGRVADINNEAACSAGSREISWRMQPQRRKPAATLAPSVW
jgi:hypothetical protein